MRADSKSGHMTSSHFYMTLTGDLAKSSKLWVRGEGVRAQVMMKFDF